MDKRTKARKRVETIFLTILLTIKDHKQITHKKLKSIISRHFNISPYAAKDYIEVLIDTEEIKRAGPFITLTEKGCQSIGLDYNKYIQLLYANLTYNKKQNTKT